MSGTFFIVTCRKTGLLTCAEGPSTMVSNTALSLGKVAADYQELTGKEIRNRFPMIRVPDNFVGVFEPDGGCLLADKCLFALKVKNYIYPKLTVKMR